MYNLVIYCYVLFDVLVSHVQIGGFFRRKYTFIFLRLAIFNDLSNRKGEDA